MRAPVVPIPGPAVKTARGMRIRLPLSGTMALVTALTALLLAALSTPGFAQFDIMNSEHFGPLRLGLSQAAVVAQFGKPASKSKEVFEAATGDYVENWSYPSRGLSLHMAGAKKGGAKTVSGITLKAPCKLASARGIRIGSTDNDVRKAYAKKELDKDFTRPGFIVAGSIYGGIMFTITGGRVTSIFLGAGAE